MSKKVSKKVVEQSTMLEKNLAPSQVPFFTDPQEHSFYFTHQADGRLSFFSPAVETVLGYSPQTCIEHFFDYLTDSPINDSVSGFVTNALKGQRQPPFEIELLADNGNIHRLEITMVPHCNDAGDLVAVESIAHDISQLHFSLSSYKRKSILLDEAEKIANMGTWDWNMETDEVRWSPAFHNILKTNPVEVIPGVEDYIQYLKSSERQLLIDHIVQSIKTNKVFEHAHRLFLKDGSVKYVETRGKTLLNAQGYPIRMIGTVHDVTEQVEAQTQLEKVYSLINSSVNEIYLFEHNSYRFSFVSGGACRNLGYSQLELTQMTPFDLCPVIPKVQIIEMMAPVLENHQQQVIFEASHQRKDGTTYPVEVHLQLMGHADEPLFVAIAMDISSKKQAQQAVRDQASLLRSVIDATPDLIFFKDKHSRYLGCNKAYEKYISQAEADIVGHSDIDFYSEQMVKLFHANDKQVLETGVSATNKEWVSYPDGKKVLLETTKSPYYNQQGEVEGVVGVSSDVTHHWAYEKNLKAQTSFLQSIIDNINESIMVIGLDHQVQLTNKAAKALMQSQVMSDPARLKCFELLHQQNSPMADGQSNKTHKTVVHNRNKTGGPEQHIELVMSPLLSEDGSLAAVIEIGRDITQHLQTQEELRQQKNIFEHGAHYDALTNLPNRVLFVDRLGQSISKAKRTKEGLAVFFIDLDRFKPINDSLGHDIGDKVLQKAAKRLRASVREMDTIARLGGDEFTVILESIRQPQSAALIAHKINQVMQKVITVDEHDLYLSASIGIALYPENGETIEELVKAADTAMYRVKQESRDSFQFYAEDITGIAFERALMESQLRSALQNKEFRVSYQPQLSLADGQIIGIEAFIRWHHPQMGLILPAKFIPLAEDVGLIQAIDEWVLEIACLQMVQWKKQGLGEIRVAVNLSPAELLRNNLYDNVIEILNKTGCDPNWLALEVTEGCFMGDPDQARTLLNQFNDVGIRLVIDDFGTGYSSVANLRTLPVSKLKIDQSFIHNVPDNADDSAIAQAVISLGRSLGMQVIAEGVETEAQHLFLLTERCDEAQGYFFGRPVSGELMGEKLGLV